MTVMFSRRFSPSATLLQIFFSQRKLICLFMWRLRQLGSDFTKVLAERKEYCCRHNLVQQDFPAKRSRRRKKTSDELSNGDIEENQTAKSEREAFIYSNDKALSSIKTRFSSHKAILVNLRCRSKTILQDYHY